MLWDSRNPTSRLLLVPLLLRWLLGGSCFDQWCGGKASFSTRIVTRFSILNRARSNRCLIVLLLHAKELTKLFVPIRGHKEYRFTGLTSTTGNGEEFRLGGGTQHLHGQLLEQGKQQQLVLCCVCQLQHLSRMGSSAVEGRKTPSSHQLSPVSHSYLRNVYLVSSWLFPGVSTKLEPNRLRVCKRILPSGRLQLAHPLGTEGAWSSCAANLWVWELRYGQLQEEQPWNGTNTIE